MAWAARTPEEVGAALRRLEAARADFEDRAKFQLALASLYFRKRDLAATEAALTEAVTREPKSVDAHLALGEFYVGKRDVAQAEREFKAAADLVPVGSLAGVRLADFYVAARKPDAIVLDLIMPGLDGFAVLERLQADPETRLLPVLVLTARRLSPDERDRLRRQAVSLLEKSSYSPQELRRLVDRALGE